MNKPKLISKSQITQKEFEDGIWQFCLDHSMPFNNVFRVNFVVVDKNELMRRIYARSTGIYIVKDENKLKKEVEKQLTKYKGWLASQKYAEERNKAISLLPKWKQKVIRKIGKIRNNLIDRWVNLLD